MKVFACVLTYNRQALLAQCLAAIVAQDRSVDGILVLDNGSSDGTSGSLETAGWLNGGKLRLLRLDQNIGASAGLDRLFRAGFTTGADWLWVMDDDVIPEPGALSALLDGFSRHFGDPGEIGYLISTLYTPDRKPNNVPVIDERRKPRSCPDWGEFLSDGMIKIKMSSIASALIPRTTLERFGGPCADFYVWGEDADYTLRITEDRPAYLVAQSRALHLRGVPGDLDIFEETEAERIARFFYLYRNTMYLRWRFWPLHAWFLFIGKSLLHAIQLTVSPRHGPKSAWIVLRGAAAGLVFRPDHVPLTTEATEHAPRWVEALADG